MKKIKFRLFLPFLLLSVLLLSFFIWYFFADSIRFRKLGSDFFQSAFTEDALSLHFTVTNPAAYGIHPEKITLPCYSASSRRKEQARDTQFYHSFQKLHPSRLKTQDADTLEQILSYLETEQEGFPYIYYEEPLSPNSGMQTQLPLLLAEYAFRSKEDVENYLRLLESVPAYFESLAEFEKEKAAAGLFMPDCDVTEIISQCDTIMNSGYLDKKTHFLQTTFASRLQKLTEKGILTEKEAASYIAENDRLLSTVLAPAYVRLGDSLLLLKGQGTTASGLAALPHGREYYRYLLKHTTGSSRTPEEIRQLLSLNLNQNIEKLRQLVSQYRDQTGNYPDYREISKKFPLRDPAEILTDLQKQMAPDFPAISMLTQTSIPCRVQNVDKALEPYTSPAYYLTAPIDDVTHNVISINRSSTTGGTDLYTTLAHEGYPGHLYQTVYSTLFQNKKEYSPARQVLFYGGFVEGWAYYVEMLSYGYAAKLLEDSVPSADILCEIMALERSIQLNLYCLLDISIHYDDMPRAQIDKILAAFGITGDSADAVYDYIRTEPATYLKYYLGYLEILSLKKEAMSQWNGSFTPLRFHRFLLENGPASFDIMRKHLLETADDTGHISENE